MADLNEPIDPIHVHSAAAIEKIRDAVLDMKMRVAKWDLRPMPEWWGKRR
jgi:hypothetical protein